MCKVKWKGKLLSCVQLCMTPWTTAACQAPLSMRFSRQGYWSGLPFPSPGDLPDPGIEPGSPALQADALPSEPPGKPKVNFLESKSSVSKCSLYHYPWPVEYNSKAKIAGLPDQFISVSQCLGSIFMILHWMFCHPWSTNRVPSDCPI